MKNKIAVLLSLALASIASAVPISGSIGFTGVYTSNNSDLTLATLISFAPGAVVTNGVTTGSFSGILNGTTVAMFTPIVVNQPGVILPGSPIWSVGGFSLMLGSIGEDFNNSQTLNLSGVGILSDGIPANNSVGDWVATFNRSGNNFTFSASSSGAQTSLPDGGTTGVLLGIGLIVIAVGRRIMPSMLFV